MEPISESPERFPGRKRWTRDDCAFLERVGFLPERYELIDGVIIDKMGQNRPHAITITLLIKWLIAVFGGDFVQCQLSIEVADADRPTYLPEPDASVIMQSVTTYLSEPPGPGDLRLVAEVSDSTLRGDLTIKAALYARAEIPEYWVLDVTGRRLFVHRNPVGGAYTSVERYSETESVATEAFPEKATTVADLLPPVSAEA
jgi:Uma2 family endonuclease